MGEYSARYPRPYVPETHRMSEVVTVADVLAAPAAFDHEHVVRSIGPAVVLVLEKEAPARMEMLASTASEFAALREWTASHPRVRDVLDVLVAGATPLGLVDRLL